jgi:hypothetical protein
MNSEESIMQAVTTIGIDIVKSVFQVHGIDPEKQCDHPPSAEAPLCDVFPEASAVPGIEACHHIIGRANSRRLATPCA